MTTTDPLTGLFMSAVQMTNYSDDPGYAIPAGTGTTAPSPARLLREAAMGHG